MVDLLALSLDASHARARRRKWVNWNQQDMEFVHPVLKQLMWTRADEWRRQEDEGNYNNSGSNSNHSEKAVFDEWISGYFKILLNEMEQWNVQPDGTTIYEIISFCAKYPAGLFPETACKYMKLYLIIMEDQKNNYWYDVQVLHSYLMVWVKSRNYGEAIECKRWYVSMSIWNKELQQTLDGLAIGKWPAIIPMGVFTRELWDFHKVLWHSRTVNNRFCAK